MQKVGNEHFETEVIKLLEKTPMPVSIDYVAHHLQISWPTARGLLMNMALDKKIEAEKTTKSLIFRLPKKDEPTCGSCKSWAGRCIKSSTLNKLASTPACADMFEPRNSAEVHHE
jgi:predicted ArsR family transcriptional regulator